jgi:hypothetical protein
VLVASAFWIPRPKGTGIAFVLGCNAILGNDPLLYETDSSQGGAGAAGSSAIQGTGGSLGQGGSPDSGGSTGGRSNEVDAARDNFAPSKDAPIGDEADATVSGLDAGCNDPILCSLPAGAKVGVVVGATAGCPSGYANPLSIHSGIVDSGCTGCTQCASNSRCAAGVEFYKDLTACAAGNNNGIAEVVAYSGVQSCQYAPNVLTETGVGIELLSNVGFSESPDVSMNHPTLVAPTWMTTVQFCARPRDQFPARAGECILYDSDVPCPMGFPTRNDTYFEGLQDNRACICDFDVISKGNCIGFSVQVASGALCDMPSKILRPGESDCSGSYNGPSIKFPATSPQGQCAAKPQITGTIDPMSKHTLCCQ